MELRQLRYLQVIAAHGSMTAAAREVGVAQSTLSEGIGKLEDELGCRLLFRNPRGVALTPAGELLVAHAETILDRVDQLPAAIAALSEGLSGSFRLACYASLGAWLLPAVMRRLLAELPDVVLEVDTMPSAAVHDAVLSRRVDLGLVVNAHPHPDLVITTVSHDRIVVMAHRERLAAAPGREALRAGPLFHLDREPFTTLLSRLAAIGELPARCVPLGDLELVRAMVSEGIGVAALPVRVARHADGGLVEVDPTLPRFDDTIHLVMRYDTPRTAALKAVRRVLGEEGARIAASDPAS